MENKEVKYSSKPDGNRSQADILASAADQLAETVYEMIRLREISKADQITKPPPEPSGHA